MGASTGVLDQWALLAWKYRFHSRSVRLQGKPHRKNTHGTDPLSPEKLNELYS